jgi:hypothetical protein
VANRGGAGRRGGRRRRDADPRGVGLARVRGSDGFLRRRERGRVPRREQQQPGRRSTTATIGSLVSTKGTRRTAGRSVAARGTTATRPCFGTANFAVGSNGKTAVSTRHRKETKTRVRMSTSTRTQRKREEKERRSGSTSTSSFCGGDRRREHAVERETGSPSSGDIRGGVEVSGGKIRGRMECPCYKKEGGRVARPGDVVTADRWCWAASLAMEEGTRRGPSTAMCGAH